MTVNTGFLTAFDGATMVDHTTSYALSTAVVNMTVQARVYTLPHGLNVNFDASSNSTITPNNAIQEVHHTVNGYTKADDLEQKLGVQGTLTHVSLGGTSKTCTAILTSAQRIGPGSVGDRATIQMRYEFRLVSMWA